MYSCFILLNMLRILDNISTAEQGMRASQACFRRQESTRFSSWMQCHCEMLCYSKEKCLTCIRQGNRFCIEAHEKLLWCSHNQMCAMRMVAEHASRVKIANSSFADVSVKRHCLPRPRVGL